MKQKTKQAAFKRFTITKNGKVMYRHQGSRHLRQAKSKTRLRRQQKLGQLSGKFAKTIKRFLP